MERFQVGDIVVHFKRDFDINEPIGNYNMMYKIIGEGMHTETEEMCVIYQALYGDKKIFIRPTTMFESEVDRNKYPNAKQKYRLEKVEVPEDKKQLYSVCVNQWITYLHCDGTIRHCKIIKVNSNSIMGKKKNAEKVSVSYNNILGLCNKPTKFNKNPNIVIPNIETYIKLKLASEINEELYKISSYSYHFRPKKELLNEIRSLLYAYDINSNEYIIIPKNLENIFKILNVIKDVISSRNYDFIHWYEYDYATDIFVNDDIIKNISINEEQDIETNYSDFIYSQYENVMDEVGKNIFNTKVVDWYKMWNEQFDICDFMEDEIKKEFWNNYPLK